jgi:hypothetical protein
MTALEAAVVEELDRRGWTWERLAASASARTGRKYSKQGISLRVRRTLPTMGTLVLVARALGVKTSSIEAAVARHADAARAARRPLPGGGVIIGPVVLTGEGDGA